MYGEDGHHAEIKCSVLPTRYTSDTDIIKIQEDRENAIIGYAVGEYYTSVGDLPRALDWLTRYHTFINSFNFTSTVPEKWRSLHAV